MENKKGLIEFLKQNGKNEVERTTLRGFLSGENEEYFESGYIGVYPTVPEEISDEVLDLVPTLEAYIKENWPELKMDYHYNAEKGCYFLSTLFALSSSWELVQGYSYYQSNGRTFYHSWIEKEGIVFDPAMRIVTTKERYSMFFNGIDRHNKKETIELFKKTGTFTYYKEDLENGTINPLLYLTFYGTEDAKETAENTLHNLNNFLKRNLENTDRVLLEKHIDELENGYYFDDFDVSATIKKHIEEVCLEISEREGISVLEAYEVYKQSSSYKELTSLQTQLWLHPSERVIEAYYDSLNEKRSRIK